MLDVGVRFLERASGVRFTPQESLQDDEFTLSCFDDTLGP